MGAPSYLLAGGGREEALASACHGAGRILSRAAAAHVPTDVYRAQVRRLRIVTPIDPDAPMLRRRRDILDKYDKRVMEEAPGAYKPIEPVIDFRGRGRDRSSCGAFATPLHRERVAAEGALPCANVIRAVRRVA